MATRNEAAGTGSCCRCNRSGICKSCSCVKSGRPCVKCMPGNLGRCQNQLSVDAPPRAAAISSPVQSTSPRWQGSLPLNPLPSLNPSPSGILFSHPVRFLHHSPCPKRSQGHLGRACSWRLHYHQHRSLYLRLVAEAFHAPPLQP